MPFDPNNDVGVKRRIRKQQQQGEAQGQAANPPGSTPSSYDTAYTSLNTVDSAAGGTLSTANVLYLSGLGSDQKELARLGKLFALNFSIAPKYMFGTTDPSQYVSPITGKHLSLHEARVFTNNFGPVAVTSMLSQALNPTVVTPGQTPGGLVQPSNVQTQAIDPKTVGKFARTLVEHNPDLTFQEGMGMSVYLTRSGYNPRQFAGNLNWVNAWLVTHGASADKKNAVQLAITALSKGTVFHSINDVIDMVAPGARAAAKAAEQQVSGANTPYQPQTAYDVQHAAASQHTQLMNIRAGAISRGKYVDAAGNPIPFDQGASTPGAQYVPTEGIPEYGSIGTDYWQQVKDEAANISADQNAFQNSYLGKVFHAGGQLVGALNVPYRKLMQGAVLTMRYPIAVVEQGIRPVYNPQNKTATAAWQEVMAAGRYQANRISQQQATVGQLITEPLGPNHQWLSSGLDFALPWFVDPLVVAGELKTAQLATRLAPETLDHGGVIKQFVEALPGVNHAVTGEHDAASLDRWIGKWNDFAGSRESKSLLNAESSDQLLSKLNRLKGSVEARQLLDPQYVTGLWERVHEAMQGSGVAPADVAAWRDLAGEDGFVYHIANGKSGAGIAADGLFPSLYNSKEPWQEGAYFTRSPAASLRLADSAGQSPLLLRVREDALPGMRTTDIPEELVAVNGADPKAVEFFASDKKWHPISDIFRSGISKTDAQAAWEEGIKVFGAGSAPEGSIADAALRARLGLADRGANDAAVAQAADIQAGGTLTEANGDVRPMTVQQSAMADALDATPQLPPGYFSREVPRKFLPEWGPRRAYNALVTSDTVTGSSLGQKIRGLSVQNTGPFLDFNGIGDHAPDAYVYNTAARSTEFTDTEARAFQKAVLDAQNSGTNVETQIENVVQDMQDQYWSRYISKWNIDPALADQMKVEAFSKSADQIESAKSQTFGVIESGDEPRILQGPQDPTQLRNRIFVQDPKRAEGMIRDYVSFRDRMWNDLQKAARQDPTLIDFKGTVGVDRLAFAKAVDKSGEIWRGYLRAWKAGTILRPGYFAKVVLLDENLKQLAMFQSLGDRLMSLGWGYRAGGPEGGVFARNIGQVADKALAPVRNFLDDTQTTRFPGLVDEAGNPIVVPRAGAFEYHQGVMSTGREADLVTEVHGGSENIRNAMSADGGWDPLILHPTSTPKEVLNHAKSWSWDLAMQYGQSPVGRVALDSVKAGDDTLATKAAILDWAAKDHYQTLVRRIGIQPSGLDQWASDYSEIVHSYTMDDKTVAQLALSGDRQSLMKRLDVIAPNVEDRPWVHGPSVALGSDRNWLTNTVDKAYGLFVQSGHDSWSWQPAFSEWKRRAEIGMYKSIAVDPEKFQKTVDVLHVPGRVAATPADLLDNPAEQVLRPTVGDANGFVYHGSPVENANSIVKNGVIPNVVTDVPKEWIPEHMQGGRAFYADSLERAKELQWKAGDSVMFRTAASKIGDSMPEELFSGSQWTRKTIVPDQFLANDGTWHPVADYGKKFVDPMMTRMVDQASTNFALGQVRRTMLDLTKQSRFSELIRFAFPFPQPFFQGFETWGHILFRNPTAMVHASQLFHLGVTSGFFKKDPYSGEYGVTAGIYRPLLIAAASGLGGDKSLMKNLDSPFMPLSNFNLALSDKLTFGGTTPVVSKVIGGVPIPVPGPNPVAQAVMQWAFKDSTSTAAQGYLFQYGPSISFLPAPVRAVAQVLFPADFQDSTEKQTLALSITEALHRTGQDRDAAGNLIPLNQDELTTMKAAKITPGVGPNGETTLDAIANHEASALMEARGLMNLFTPTAGRVAFEGQRDDQAAFQQMLTTNGDDYAAALKEWYQKFPDKMFIPVGKTLTDSSWKGGQANVRLPASELTYQMLRTPGVGEFMAHNPEWAPLLLVGTDPNIQDTQSFQAFSDLISRGNIKYKTPDQYYTSASDEKGWLAYTNWSSSTYGPALDKAIKDNGGSYSALTQSLAWNGIKDQRQQFFAQQYQDNPHWVLSHLQWYPDQKAWDWPTSDGGVSATDLTNAQAARHGAEAIITNPDLASFPGVQALKTYIDGTTKIKQRQDRLQIPDINSDAAKEAGLFQDYQKVVNDALEQQPDIAPFLSQYFGIRLSPKMTNPTEGAPGAQPGIEPTVSGYLVESTNDLVSTTSQSRLSWVKLAADEGMRHTIIKFDTELSNFKRDANTLGFETFDRSSAYHKVDVLQEHVWANDPKVLKEWYKSKGTTFQKDYKDYLAVKPMGFYTPFDYHVAGIEMPAGAQKKWNQITTAIYQIGAYKNDHPTWSSSDGYDQVNRAVSGWLQDKKTPKSVVQAINASNVWGWGVDHILGYGVPEKTVDKNGKPLSDKNLLRFGNYRSKADWQWAQFLDVARQTQAQVIAADSHGVSGFDTDASKNAYKAAQDALAKVAREYSDPKQGGTTQFRDEWQSLTSLNGGAPLVGSMFLPDTYYGPLGYWKNGGY